MTDRRRDDDREPRADAAPVPRLLATPATPARPRAAATPARPARLPAKARVPADAARLPARLRWRLGKRPDPPPDDLWEPYAEALRRLVVEPLREVDEAALRAYEAAWKEENREDSSGLRLDVRPDILRAIREAERSYRAHSTARQLDRQLREAADRVNAFSGRQTAEALRGPYSRVLEQSSTAVREQVSSWVRENAALVRTVPERHRERLQRGVERAWREGWTPERLSAWITSNTRTAQADADRIARDQIGKLNGRLARERQKEAGVRQYIWGPTSSANPRELHEGYRGGTFSWDDPPEGGHPGELINCSCVAIPVVRAGQTLEDLAGETAS